MKIRKWLVFTNIMGEPKGSPTPLPFHVMLMGLEIPLGASEASLYEWHNVKSNMYVELNSVYTHP